MSPDDGGAEPLARFAMTAAAAPAKAWTLAVYADSWRLIPDAGDPHDVARAEVPDRVQTFDGLLLRHMLGVKLGSKVVLFKLAPEAFAAVRAWIGPPTAADLRAHLKRRLKWVFPIGLLFVLTAMPMGDLDWEPVSLALGLGLILTGRMAKLWPHRVFFAVDAVWFAGLAANSGWLLAQEWGWLRAALFVLQLSLIGSGWREYRRFAPERMAPADDPDAGWR